MEKRIGKFVVTGTFGTVLGMGLLLFFVEILGFSVIFSNSLSYCFVFIVSFLIHKMWTFESRNSKFGKQFFTYLVVSLIGLAMSNTLLFILINHGIWYIYAKIIAIFIIGFWSFSINNFFTFKHKW
ncbi:MAG: GtrA family protein [Candidatus Paceibacterota bacterium]|jgi:putative flippase GtrA